MKMGGIINFILFLDRVAVRRDGGVNSTEKLCEDENLV